MKQGSKRLYSMILSGLLLVIAVVIYFHFITAAYGNLQTEKGQLISEQNLYQNEQQIASGVNTLLKTYQGDSSSSQLVALALPTGQSTAPLLAQIYGIAQNAGVVVQSTGLSIQEIQSVQPASTPPPVTGSPDSLAGAATTGSIIKPTGTVSVQISGSGSYEGFKIFLAGLETNIRVLDVTSIKLQPNTIIIPVKGQPANSDMFNFNVTVTAYYQGQ